MAKVLVIDDDASSAKSLALALALEGFETRSAMDVDAAMAQLEREIVDLVIVDLMLRGVNGIQVARQLSLRFPSVRVVLTSAYHLSERQLMRSNCGAIGFVPKPYAIAELGGFLRSKLA